MRLDIVIIVTGTVLLVFLIFFYLSAFCMKEPDPKFENKKIVRAFQDGNADEIYSFFDQYTGDRVYSISIVNSALAFNIPVPLFFGLCHSESRFNFDAISKSNTNGTRDYGGFQLNSKTYEKYQKTELMDPLTNARLAAAHLARCYEKRGNWYEGLVIYNCGNIKNANQKSLKYLVDILRYADRVERDFYNSGL